MEATGRRLPQTLHSRTPTKVAEWSTFPAQAAALNHSNNRTLDPALYQFRVPLHASNEGSVTSALDINVYYLLNRLSTTTTTATTATATTPATTSTTTPTTTPTATPTTTPTTQQIGPPSDVTKVIGEPDRICYIQSSQLRMVIEVKTHLALSCINLFAKYQNDMIFLASNLSPTNSVWRQVHQIFSYMCHNSLRYGVITTYYTTWFMMWDGRRLLISPPIPFDATGPTVLQCYSYIMSLADQNHTSPPPPPSPSPSPPPESPPGEDNNDDSNDGGYHERKKHTRDPNQQQSEIVTRSKKRKQHDFPQRQLLDLLFLLAS